LKKISLEGKRMTVEDKKEFGGVTGTQKERLMLKTAVKRLRELRES